jgi:hypothetical protein
VTDQAGEVFATMTSIRPKSIKSELARLADLERVQLRDLWRDLYGSDPPQQISQLLLSQAVAHRLQVKALGGLNFSSRRALVRAAEESGSKLATTPAQQGIDTGSVLVRVWHGETHQVTTLKKGVQYRGKRYRSLSEVVREITGTRWSGPRFFGLKGAAKNRVAR